MSASSPLDSEAAYPLLWQEGLILYTLHRTLSAYSSDAAAPTAGDVSAALLSRDSIYAGYLNEANASATAGGLDAFVSAALAKACEMNSANEDADDAGFDGAVVEVGAPSVLRVSELLGPGETLLDDGDGTTNGADDYGRALDDFFSHSAGPHAADDAAGDDIVREVDAMRCSRYE